jgi:hypothetical protein
MIMTNKAKVEYATYLRTLSDALLATQAKIANRQQAALVNQEIDRRVEATLKQHGVTK